eukprot:m.130802 g.130802  ORF g.130802 m.130802 type:complete len:133 (+) comp13911_c0_seq4:253-651(+)
MASPTFESEWEIAVSQFRDCGDCIMYRVDLCLNGEQWCLWRRFSHFKDLHKMVKAKLGSNMPNVPFPSDHVLTTMMKKTNLSEEFLTQRQQDLGEYLLRLVRESYGVERSPFRDTTAEALGRELCFFRKGGV